MLLNQLVRGRGRTAASGRKAKQCAERHHREERVVAKSEQPPGRTSLCPVREGRGGGLAAAKQHGSVGRRVRRAGDEQNSAVATGGRRVGLTRWRIYAMWAASALCGGDAREGRALHLHG